MTQIIADEIPEPHKPRPAAGCMKGSGEILGDIVSPFYLELESSEHLSPVAARMMLAAFPSHVREAFERRAKEIDYPVEAVLEMAIAGFLDGEALSFVDCQPRY
jgi:hypothetical protein